MCVVIFHMYFYKFRKIHLLFFLLVFIGLMFVGRIYKDVGVSFNESTRLENVSNREMTFSEEIIIGDLSRYPVNTYEIYSLQEKEDFQFRHGQTYLWSLFTFVPFGNRIVRALDIDSRSEATSSLFGTERNSRILGPLGEWMINFGIWSFPFAFLIVSLLLRWIKKITLSFKEGDLRRIFTPFFLIFIPQVILSDSSNVMFFFIKRVALVYFVLFLIADRRRVIS